MQDTPSTSDGRDLFLLKDTAQYIHKTYAENVWKTIGFYILVLGWLITSSDARDYLQTNTGVFVGFLILVGASLVFHWLVQRENVAKSLDVSASSGAEGEQHNFDYYKITDTVFYCNFAVVVAIIVAIILVLGYGPVQT